MNDRAVTLERALAEPFRGVSVAVVSVAISVGSASTPLILMGEPGVLDQIETVVREGVLRIGPASGTSFSTSIPIEVAFAARHLERILASAGARVRVEGLAGPRLEVQAASGARLELSGEVRDLRVSSESGARVELGRMRWSSLAEESRSGGTIRY